MEDEPRSAQIFRFGVFEADLASGELRKQGVKIRLQEQPFRILVLLLSRAGEVVSRDEICRTVWPSDTFVDFEQGVGTAVKKLRQALRDDAETPRYIETLPKRGFRFIAAVDGSAGLRTPQTQDTPAPITLPPAKPSSAPERPRRRLPQISRPFVALLLVLATVGAAVLIWTRTGRQPIQPELIATPLTSYRGAESGPSFSPDGTRVAFSWDGPNQDNCDIYVKLVGPGDPLRLSTSPACDHDPAWSPDGNWIGFLRDGNDGMTTALILIPALGGQEREVTRTRRPEGTFHLEPDSPALSWSADGNWLFTLDKSSANSRAYAVICVSIESGEKQQLTFPSADRSDNAVAVSPDGRALAFTRLVSGTRIDLYALSLSEQHLPKRAPERVLSGGWVESIAWTGHGRELLFSGNVGGKEGLWRTGVFGSRKLTRLAGIGPNTTPTKRQAGLGSASRVNLTVSRRGSRLVYSQGLGDANIWRVALAGDERGKTARFVSSTRDETNPSYSPDGQKIAFESDRSGHEEIWVCNADGSVPFQLTKFGSGWSGSPQWSPDSRTIVFDRLEEKRWDIYRVQAQGGKPVRLVTNAGDNSAPSWSRDGHWIYFDSTQTGRFEVWRVPSAGGQQIQVTKNVGGAAMESADGKDLYYSKLAGLNDAELWKMPLNGGEEKKILAHLFRPRAYGLAEHGIYFVERPQGTPLLRFLDFKTQQVSSVASLQGFALGGRVTVSPDERWFLYAQDDGTGTDLMLVENFQ